MKKGERTRLRMIEIATRLIQEQGYAATGINQILAESGSPRGSFYHHFPGGKEELACAVVDAHAIHMGELLSAAAADAPDAITAAELAVEVLAQELEGSGCRSGCPVTAIAFEMASRSDTLRAATQAAYAGWAELVTARLEGEGQDPEGARERARTLLSAIEGALIMGRAYGGRGPLDDLKASLPRLLAG